MYDLFCGIREYMPSIYILFGFMIADVLTGVLYAFKTGTVNSSIGKNGALVKLATIVGLAFVYLADVLFESRMVMFKGFIMILSIFEGISVIENLGNIGVRGATYLSAYFEQMNPLKGEKKTSILKREDNEND